MNYYLDDKTPMSTWLKYEAEKQKVREIAKTPAEYDRMMFEVRKKLGL